jgi:hypothetical protein
MRTERRLEAGGAPAEARAIAEACATDTLLERRDRFIASRIDATLEPEETGILFIGALHSVALYLNPDIQVIYPLYRPVRDGSAGRRT